MNKLLKNFDAFIKSSTTSKTVARGGYSYYQTVDTSKLEVIKHNMISIIKNVINYKEATCVDEACKVKETLVTHRVLSTPQLLVLNLSWGVHNAKTQDIVNIMISIPEQFKLDELYDL